MVAQAINIDVVGLEEVQGYLKKFPDETYQNARDAIHNAMFKAKATTQQNTRTRLKVRSGALRRSIRFATSGKTLSTIRGSFYAAHKEKGATVAYAPIHEYGGTVKAKNAYKKVPGGPYLNIPAKANKTPAGVMRSSARQVFQNGGFIRGRTVILNGKVMFYLVKQVKIRPRLGMNKAADAEIPTLLGELQDMIGEY